MLVRMHFILVTLCKLFMYAQVQKIKSDPYVLDSVASMHMLHWPKCTSYVGPNVEVALTLLQKLD